MNTPVKAVPATPATPTPVPEAGHAFVVGDRFVCTRIVDDALVRACADVTGDHNKIHVDEASAETTIFGQRIAHGGILLGMTRKPPGDEMLGIGAIYLSQMVNFHALMVIDDTVTWEVTVTARQPKHVAKIGCVMRKQAGEVVVDGVATIKLPGRLIKC